MAAIEAILPSIALVTADAREADIASRGGITPEIRRLRLIILSVAKEAPQP